MSTLVPTHCASTLSMIRINDMKIMKLSQQPLLRTLFCGVALCLALTAHAQSNNKKVAVGTRTPTETLDVNGTLRVAVLPEDGDQLIFTQSDGTAAANFDQRYTANRVVMADKNGVLGFAPAPPAGFFYMPPVLLPLSKYAVDNVFAGKGFGYEAPAAGASVNGTYTINLHSLYQEQFQTTTKSNASASLPVYPAAQLDFFVTYYDAEIFQDVQLSNQGVLTYKVKTKAGKDITPTENTFMNVIFRVK